MHHIEVHDEPDASARAALHDLSLSLGGGRHRLSERKVAALDGREPAHWSLLLRRDAAATPASVASAPVQAAAVVRWEHAQGMTADAGDAAEDTGDQGPVATAELLLPRPEAGAAVLAAIEQAVAARGGGLLHVWAYEEDAAQTLSAAGHDVVRRLELRARGLDAPPADPRWPAGVTVAPLALPRDGEALLAVNNRAFRDHPEQGGMGPPDLEARASAPWFDPEDVRCAWRDGALLGFHWLKRHPEGAAEVPGREPLGEVYVLAVDPAAQGSGLGRALLRHGLAHLRDRGCAEAVLFVEADEPAARLYADEGFAVRQRHACYGRWVGAASSARGPAGSSL